MNDRVVTELEKWLQENQFRGWDPFDALNSPLARVLSLGTHAGRTFWVQLLKRLPWNIRPLLGIKPQYNPKGMGLLLAAYARKYRLTGNDADAAQASELARWLLENGNGRFGGLGWGYHFPWPNRAFYCPPGVPTVVNTAFCGLALLDAARPLTTKIFWRGQRRRRSSYCMVLTFPPGKKTPNVLPIRLWTTVACIMPTCWAPHC